MKAAVYTRPNKPDYVQTKKRDPLAPVKLAAPIELVTVDRATECHVTPEGVARRMVDYVDNVGHTLEPSAGTGALVSALLDAGHTVTAIERHHKLADVVRSLGVPTIQDCFLEYASETGARFENVVANPPFSQVRKHIKAALSLLAPGGTLVALVPITFDHPSMETLETLPEDTFSTCTVRTKIIRIRNRTNGDIHENNTQNRR